GERQRGIIRMIGDGLESDRNSEKPYRRWLFEHGYIALRGTFGGGDGAERAAASRALRTLESRGLVECVRGESGRVGSFNLTAAGREAYRQMTGTDISIATKVEAD